MRILANPMDQHILDIRRHPISSWKINDLYDMMSFYRVGGLRSHSDTMTWLNVNILESGERGELSNGFVVSWPRRHWYMELVSVDARS